MKRTKYVHVYCFVQSPPRASISIPAGFMRPASVAKNIILINGTDGVAGVEYGSTLAYHPGWDLHMAYVSSPLLVIIYDAVVLDTCPVVCTYAAGYRFSICCLCAMLIACRLSTTAA